MKCRAKNKIFTTKAEVEKACQKEIESRIEKLYEEVKRDVARQVMATCLYELNKEFGFGKDRLNKFYDGVSAMFMLMESGVMGGKFSTEDCINHCKEKFKINLDEIK